MTNTMQSYVYDTHSSISYEENVFQYFLAI